jgi:hypothetical protein
MFSPCSSFASFVDAFDIFADCYVYGSIAYLTLITVIKLICGLLDIIEEHQLSKKNSVPNFYDQIKELINPNESNDFTAMTIQELRNYVRENQLHDRIKSHHGKSVSKACKQELIAALQ